jgi:hypothetical protein
MVPNGFNVLNSLHELQARPSLMAVRTFDAQSGFNGLFRNNSSGRVETSRLG